MLLGSPLHWPPGTPDHKFRIEFLWHMGPRCLFCRSGLGLSIAKHSMSSQEPRMVFFRLMTRLGGGAQTLAYLLPVLSMALQRAEAEFEALAAQNKSALAGSLQAVVVVPSRELAMQIARVGQSLLPHQARGCVQQAIGGANINRQVLHPVLRGMKLSLIQYGQVLSPVARGKIMSLVQHCPSTTRC
jgi:hypothetical protein